MRDNTLSLWLFPVTYIGYEWLTVNILTGNIDWPPALFVLPLIGIVTALIWTIANSRSKRSLTSLFFFLAMMPLWTLLRSSTYDLDWFNPYLLLVTVAIPISLAVYALIRLILMTTKELTPQ